MGCSSSLARPRHQELAGQPVRALAPDGHGGALAIVDGHSLCRRTVDGEWSTIATSEFRLACSVAVGDVIYVGTDDARLLRVSANGKVDQLGGFDAVAGRDRWYAGSALINGQLVGPPLGIRSITATSDGTVLLANVHVGGIPRSTDGGVTWQPTIDVDSDVHEVCAHPIHPGIVIAAAAIGLCISRDSGATWTVEQEGLHASYCSAVAFSGNDILVSASADHFATQGAVYRRPIDEHGSAGARRCWPAQVDRRHRRHGLHRHARLGTRGGRQGWQPIRVSGRRAHLVTSRQRPSNHEQCSHCLSARGKWRSAAHRRMREAA